MGAEKNKQTTHNSTRRQPSECDVKLVESSAVFPSLSAESVQAEPQGAAETQLVFPEQNKHLAATTVVPEH